MTLFAVTLGGRAPKANTELHDVVFVTGDAIEDTYVQLLDKWFGTPEGLHLDSWMALDVVDGYRVTLSPTPDIGAAKLFFVNLGAYRDGAFAEDHANVFVVAESAPAAKARARSEMQKTGVHTVHKDYLYDVDDCIALDAAGALHVVLTKTGEASRLVPHSDYHVIPKTVIADYVARKR
ncbi:MAG TPA: DUF1543 domain-containing protein [Rhizomicrobium sp.]|jgi:hypothetical protein|nr:DUF1543 domain-containing protein [Rhizomicrobium sp.]